MTSGRSVGASLEVGVARRRSSRSGLSMFRGDASLDLSSAGLGSSTASSVSPLARASSEGDSAASVSSSVAAEPLPRPQRRHSSMGLLSDNLASSASPASSHSPSLSERAKHAIEEVVENIAKLISLTEPYFDTANAELKTHYELLRKVYGTFSNRMALIAAEKGQQYAVDVAAVEKQMKYFDKALLSDDELVLSDSELAEREARLEAKEVEQPRGFFSRLFCCCFHHETRRPEIKKKKTPQYYGEKYEAVKHEISKNKAEFYHQITLDALLDAVKIYGLIAWLHTNLKNCRKEVRPISEKTPLLTVRENNVTLEEAVSIFHRYDELIKDELSLFYVNDANTGFLKYYNNYLQHVPNEDKFKFANGGGPPKQMKAIINKICDFHSEHERRLDRRTSFT